MQKRVYKTTVCDTSDLKQHLTDTRAQAHHNTPSTNLLIDGESGYMHARKRKDITLNIC